MGYNDLVALAAEAQRRHITYGQLVAETTPKQRAWIVKRYQMKLDKQKEKRTGK